MKKLLIMISAMTAAVFSTAKADISVSGSAGLAMSSGKNVLDGNAAQASSRSTSGTLFMQGGGVTFAMSTTTAGGLTVSTSGGISLDADDSATSKAMSVLLRLLLLQTVSH